MRIRRNPYRPAVRVALFVLIAVALVCLLDGWNRHRASGWVRCQDSSCVCAHDHEWCMLRARWWGERLECECGLEALHPRPDVVAFRKPAVVVYCHFRDHRDDPLEVVAHPIAVKDDFQSGRLTRASFRFQVDVPTRARSVAVQLGDGAWTTRYVKLPPRPADPLGGWMPF
jgi:hypothetical protein